MLEEVITQWETLANSFTCKPQINLDALTPNLPIANFHKRLIFGCICHR